VAEAGGLDGGESGTENGLRRCVRSVLALDLDLDATSIAEALWLAASRASAGHGPPSAVVPDAREQPAASDEDQASPERRQPAPPPPWSPDRAARLDHDSSGGIEPLVTGRRALVGRARSGPQPLDLSRALRPFKRRWPNGRKLQLDIEETVRSYARTWKLVPKFRSAPERWFEVDIVIDDSLSMTVWGDLISVLSTLLRQLGAFRTIRTWRISVTGPVPLLHNEGGQPARAGQLRSPGGRRLILLVSDGSAAGWLRPEAWAMVREWAGSTPTALISPLATRLWGRTGLDLPTARVGPGAPGSGNAQLQYTVPRRELDDDQPSAGGGWLPLPVATFTPHMLGRWARMLMKADPRGCDALLIPPVRHPPERDEEDAADPAAGARLVDAFRRAASPEAARLGVLCAPFSAVSLELLELLSAELTPEASTEDLAEVIVGGLFRPASAGRGVPGSELLRFRPGVRERLRELLPETDAWRTYNALIKHVTEAAGADATFAAGVPDPLGDIAIPADLLPLAAASREALEFLDALPAPWRDEPMITVTRPAAGSFPAIWGNVPARDPGFTGRGEILAELRELMNDGAATAAPVTLLGFGPVGKTAIAAEYAHRHQGDYDVIWWIPASRRDEVIASLAALAGRLRLPAADSGAEEAARAALDALTRGQPFSRWLLILDRADYSAVTGLVPAGSGHVLITSGGDVEGVAGPVVHVDPFTRRESVQFLRERIPDQVDAGEADRLAGELGDLPLALEQAGALIAQTRMTVREYLERLNQEVRELLLDDPAHTHYPVGLRASLTMALSELSRRSPHSIELLYHLVFLDGEQISVNLLREGASELGSTPGTLAETLDRLARFALLSHPGRNTISVQRLVQALVRDELLDPPREPYPDRVRLMLAAVAPSDPADSSHWPRYGELLRHQKAVGLSGSSDRRIRDFALNVMRYLRLSGDLTACQSMAEAFIALWRETSGSYNSHVLQAELQLAAALRQGGGYAEACLLTDQAYRSARPVLGEQAEVTMELRAALAQDLRLRGDFADALALDRENRGILAASWGTSDPQAVKAASDEGLGLLLASKYREARDLLERVFGEYVEGDVPASEVAATWTRLSWAIRLGGNYAKARETAMDARDYARARLGPRHQATIRAATALAIALRKLGPPTLDEARDLAQEVAAVSASALGPKHPDALAALVSLANCERELGLLDTARQHAEEASAGYEAVFGPDHPVTLGCLGGVGLLHRRNGDPAAARDADERALAGFYRRLTADHHYSLSVAINLASDLAALGEHHEARVIGEDALRRSRALLGEDHPGTLGCAVNLALDLRADDAPDYTERLHSDTMRRYVRALGGDHPDTKVALTGERIDFDFDPSPL
jgi:Tetratricopeptide repeat